MYFLYTISQDWQSLFYIPLISKILKITVSAPVKASQADVVAV